MSLVFEIVGTLVVGGLLGLLTGRSVSPTAAGITAIAVAIGGISFWAGVFGIARAQVQAVSTYPGLVEANATPGTLFPADEALLRKADALIPRRESTRVFLVCAGGVGCSGEYISYRLSPRLFVGSIEHAEYVLVYGVPPARVPASARRPVIFTATDGGVVRGPQS